MDLCNLSLLCLRKCADIVGRAVSRASDSLLHSPGSLQTANRARLTPHMKYENNFASSYHLVRGNTPYKAHFPTVLCWFQLAGQGAAVCKECRERNPCAGWGETENRKWLSEERMWLPQEGNRLSQLGITHFSFHWVTPGTKMRSGAFVVIGSHNCTEAAVLGIPNWGVLKAVLAVITLQFHSNTGAKLQNAEEGRGKPQECNFSSLFLADTSNGAFYQVPFIRESMSIMNRGSD